MSAQTKQEPPQVPAYGVIKWEGDAIRSPASLEIRFARPKGLSGAIFVLLPFSLGEYTSVGEPEPIVGSGVSATLRTAHSARHKIFIVGCVLDALLPEARVIVPVEGILSHSASATSDLAVDLHTPSLEEFAPEVTAGRFESYQVARLINLRVRLPAATAFSAGEDFREVGGNEVEWKWDGKDPYCSVNLRLRFRPGWIDVFFGKELASTLGIVGATIVIVYAAMVVLFGRRVWTGRLLLIAFIALIVSVLLYKWYYVGIDATVQEHRPLICVLFGVVVVLFIPPKECLLADLKKLITATTA